MSQLSFSFNSSVSFDSSLMVRDERGLYHVASADQILSAARQAIEQKFQRGIACTSPAMIKEYLCAKLAAMDHEVFAVMLMDNQNCLIEYVEMFHGSINQAAVYPREVVKLALKHNAAAMIVSHNHPSGSAEPSEADKMMTQTLQKALALVDVRLLDHVIVAGGTTASFAQRGLL
jgi:DNA repair protein RadC